MRVDEVIDSLNKSDKTTMTVKDSTRSDMSMYMSLRKYIKRHNLDVAVNLSKGDIVLTKLPSNHASKTSGTD